MLLLMKRRALLLPALLCLSATVLCQEALKVDVDKPGLRIRSWVSKREKSFRSPPLHAEYHYPTIIIQCQRKTEGRSGGRAITAINTPNCSRLYSLEQTAGDKQELDSVIYKVTTGILIHDLRNNWLDNMYLLMGKAYYFRNQLDTAYQTFQYINYAFSPKEKDGYDKVIGSNSNEGGSAFSIVTP
jgi:hypothetical protein